MSSTRAQFWALMKKNFIVKRRSWYVSSNWLTSSWFFILWSDLNKFHPTHMAQKHSLCVAFASLFSLNLLVSLFLSQQKSPPTLLSQHYTTSINTQMVYSILQSYETPKLTSLSHIPIIPPLCDWKNQKQKTIDNTSSLQPASRPNTPTSTHSWYIHPSTQ